MSSVATVQTICPDSGLREPYKREIGHECYIEKRILKLIFMNTSRGKFYLNYANSFKRNREVYYSNDYEL